MPDFILELPILTLDGISLILSGSNGMPLGNYIVLVSSNLTTWTPLATNQLDVNGEFSFTTNTTAWQMQDFYRLQLQ